MIPSTCPIKSIHVSVLDGSQLLWCRWITQASDYRFLKSVYRCLRGTPTVYTPHKGPEMAKARLFAAVSALRLRSLPSSRHLAISPLRRASHTTTPSSSPHRHALTSTRTPHPLLLWARAPHPPLFLPPSLPPSARHTSRAVLTFVFFLHAFHVLPRSPPRPLPECLLISCSFLEASGGLRCRPPPACGGAPGAVLVCCADHCFILRTIRQR